MARGRLRIGTSGYQYEHWRGVFYPQGLPRKDWFAFYAARFETVEINNTFYRLPDVRTFDRWREMAPPGFVYAIKFSRFGTHKKRLKDPEGPIDLFLERVRLLEPHLGPILVQLPPSMRFDPGRLEGFLRAAPRSHRWAVEVRHESWFRKETYEILSAHDAALVIHDMLPSHPREMTASFLYQRFHGRPGEATYPRQALVAEARRVKNQLASGRDSWIYFNNDELGHALADAEDLRRYLEMSGA